MKSVYNIGDLVRELKINKETIRYYEKIGLLSEPKRDKNGYRIYSKGDIDKIRFILIVKNFGFSLKEISMLLPKIYDEILEQNIDNIKAIVEYKIREINNKINDLEATKKLLQKVNDNILSNNGECCTDMEIYLKNNS
ncbi:MerR family transcriptional regulator [Clostridium pasteurianum]|uniref:Putative transcriptional regulator n=1 Tax=Clostridium pasteurianum BC1 TaxID=86416 RepID=R4K564_CLOPA|nr:MerR family transcriptional regulator [Clostridium pasteurianum]AGK96846.1 putative transcriptional regulator [Clostridium pasteurianum BC1]